MSIPDLSETHFAQIRLNIARNEGDALKTLTITDDG
jgi:hypothetical protein